MCLGRPAAARRAFEQSLALDPDQPRLRELLSRDR
jgi:Flp pilus assembly protein TadD